MNRKITLIHNDEYYVVEIRGVLIESITRYYDHRLVGGDELKTREAPLQLIKQIQQNIYQHENRIRSIQ